MSSRAQELTSGSSYCTFEFTADVIAGIGDAMTSTFESLGISALGASLADTVGTWIGDFQTSIDAFLLVLLTSFAVGFVYMVMLRFLIGICVWLSAGPLNHLYIAILYEVL